jgi:hydrogenase expression/formation protein HypE
MNARDTTPPGNTDMSDPKRHYVRPLDVKHGRVDMGHGAGGRAAAQLIRDIFLAAFDNPYLRQGDDGALLPAPGPGRLVMATDAHVVSPLFFPGGDLGCLSVHGTINDVAMMGARPLYLSASFILEEGFALAELQRIVQSMARAAQEAGVPIVTGDTKVVEKGKGDGLFISTTGVGVVPTAWRCRAPTRAWATPCCSRAPSATTAWRCCRSAKSLSFGTSVVSDTAALHTLVDALLRAAPGALLHVLRDPTRGGLATTLNEITQQSQCGHSAARKREIPVQPRRSKRLANCWAWTRCTWPTKAS